MRANRERFEHAIAVLVGKAPGDFALAPAPWSERVPAIPLGVPSTLLQRRPDIAAAERQVAAANAQIGIAAVGVLPEPHAERVDRQRRPATSAICSAPRRPLWSFGVAVAQTLFDAGATAPASTQARAAHEDAVARYRQTVLTAFQDVEDQLTTARSQAEQADLRQQASDAADQTEQQILNRYRAGQLGYTDVVTAQASALTARRALVQVAVEPADERGRPDPGARRRLGRRRAGRAEELAAQRQHPLSIAPVPRGGGPLSKHLRRDAVLLRQNLRSTRERQRAAMRCKRSG